MIVAALFLLAAATAEPPGVSEGRKVFQRCYSCHSMDPKDRNLPGPSLIGVVGRAAGRDPAFEYSPALRRAAAGGLVWTEAALDRFLADPDAVVPRTEMTFVGLRNPRDRQAVIAYLKAGERGR